MPESALVFIHASLNALLKSVLVSWKGKAILEAHGGTKKGRMKRHALKKIGAEYPRHETKTCAPKQPEDPQTRERRSKSVPTTQWPLHSVLSFWSQ